ncbi:PREDICTED: kinesin-like protein KIN-7I isoform X1 [Drosophila arizonae]|uniref:Kinesin-like protein KIN-7I isoform X1 n=1 Tax=Drosophila arizonae TaxID=7263 RepID=A0ABM1NWQ6_DROAR|nr:PREDICTED: kinesin-like protein KIN-7I isoform X1 [Drosophila arizonae]
MSAKNAIQVCIKVRPCEQDKTTLWQVKDNRAIQIIDGQSEPCVFDYVFDQDTNNQIVFDCMAKHIIEACMKGFNGTIFAYGQTSSGKTYTMMGDEQNPGVMVLAAKEIFKQIARHNDRDFLLRVGYIEIYNEKIYDLLNKKNQDLKIHESNGMVHVNCEECIITSEEDLLQFLCMGNKERTVGETNMNERSSRSHAIFRIIIESRKTDRNDDDAVIQSLLNLVDLAGSERADQTGARGARLKEGGHINKSLHFLSNVIKSLAENEENKYVSFRDSKLTRILQASLGGNAFTSIICSIKPSILEESQSTLNFAMRAKKIRSKPQMNEIVSDATMMKRLEREIKELKDRLAEEQRRNESQIKVRLLEQRIKTDTLKIISSNTIADNRNKNRRRTWCPATSNPHPVAANGDEAAPSPTATFAFNGQRKFSGLPKPTFNPSTPYLSHRPGLNAPKTINIMKSLEVTEEEEFKPSADFNFGDVPDPMTNSRILPPLSLTPRISQGDERSKQMIERDLVELSTFVKLEQNIGNEWEDLNNKFAVATAQVDELQSERVNLIERCEALQAEVDALTKSKQAADTKIEQYEEQLKKLKQTVERLEMENRAAIDLEFQFENHKSKSKLRENELLSVLSEKVDTIDNLEKTLKELSKDVLRNSKEDHMRSMCPEIEVSCERICDKCVDLERMLEEFKKTTSNGDAAQVIDSEREQLRAEIANTRAQLETVQSAYRQMETDVAEKSELCDRLSRDVISAEEAKTVLQEKCDDLEIAQQQQDEVIRRMQAEYDAIQTKYQKLQQDYELLEQATAASEEEHRKLLLQNESLQQEISALKESFEQVQKTLLQTTNEEDKSVLLEQLKAHNDELVANLAQLEAKYNEMQHEYEDLSNQLVDSMQDGDSLREQCNALQEELKQHQAATDKLSDEKDQRIEQLLSHIAELESEVAEKNSLIDATEGTINEMREQMTNLESALLEKSVIVNKVEDYQRQIESLEKQHAEMTMVYEELQEKVKENTINESQIMSNSAQTLMSEEDGMSRQSNEDVAAKLSDLNAEVNRLQSQIQLKDELIEKIQSELHVLNDRFISMDVLHAELQANAQTNQGLLEQQAAKLTEDANRIDKLQESNAQLLERCLKAEEAAEALKQRLTQPSELDRLKEEHEKRVTELQIELDNAKKELNSMEKQNKDHLNNIQLEYLEKIELSECEYRENLRKYNIEWEESKDRYEALLQELQIQLSSTEERCAKLSADSEAEIMSVKSANNLAVDQLVKEKQDLESMYDASQKLVQQMTAQLSSKEQDAQREHALVTSSNDQLQLLREKYESQIHEYERLKTEHELTLEKLKVEKGTLQSSVAESELRIEQLSNELLKVQDEREQEKSLAQQLHAELSAYADEKVDYEEKIEILNAKIEVLSSELRQANLKASDLEKLLQDHEEIKTHLCAKNDLNIKLTHKVENLESELSLANNELTTRKAEVEKLNLDLQQGCSQQSKLVNKLQKLEAEIVQQAQQFERKLVDLESAKGELQLRLDSLDLLKREREQAARLQESTTRLQVDKEKLEEIKNRIEKEKIRLEEVSARLEEEKSRLEGEITQLLVHKERLKEANAELQSRLLDKEANCDALQQQLRHQERRFHENKAELQNKLNAMEASCDAMKTASEQQKIAFVQLEERLATALAGDNKTIDELRLQKENLQKDIDNLRASQIANRSIFDEERKRLDYTISSLLEDKRSLEEKLCTTTEILKKLEAELRMKTNGSNTSFDSSASSTSPGARRSVDRDFNQPRKSVSIDSEVRRNRRISTHDERRRQSYWNDCRHVGCMTDPVDNNCNCAELDRKLQDCQRELFIKESMVTALNIELKNHPLKEETALLKKRLLDEQAKARDEIKRIKQKNAELMSKINVYTASAAITASSRTPVEGKTVETQTESTLEAELKKMTDKFHDSIQLCRHRYNKIKDLENQLRQNENNDTSNISSQTAGQISALKSQLEAQKKEISTLSNKYEYAKRALKMRRDELDELRQVAGIDAVASTK